MKTFPYFMLFLFVSVSIMAAEPHPSIVKQEFIYDEAPFPSCHASTIEQTQSGVLVAAWFGGTDEGNPDVGIWLSRYENGTWSDPVEVAKEERVPCWNPVLIRMPDNELVLYYKAGENPRAWSGLLKRSRDEGNTWSEPELLPAGILGPIKNKPIFLPDGTLLCGSSMEAWRTWASWMEITSDSGKTWKKYGPITPPNSSRVPDGRHGIIQPTMYIAKDGSIHSLFRSTGDIGKISHAVSKDNGQTWSEALPVDLPNPNAGFDCVKLKDGRIALIYNQTPRGRTPLNIAVSNDDGKTWQMKVVLEDEPGEYSYPAIIQTADGMIHTTYTWKREKIKHVTIDPAKL